MAKEPNGHAPDPASARPEIVREMLAEPDAFDALYRMWLPVVRDSARSHVPCDDDAEVAAQKVFFRLWKRGPVAWRPNDPEHFFTRAGHNEALTVLRRRRRRRHREVPLTPAVVASLESHTLAPDEITERDELHAGLIQAIEHLPPRCQAVMGLIVMEGLTQAEVAKRLGITVPAVTKQVARGKHALGKSCRRFGEGSEDHLFTFSDRGGGVIASWEHLYCFECAA